MCVCAYVCGIECSWRIKGHVESKTKLEARLSKTRARSASVGRSGQESTKTITETLDILEHRIQRYQAYAWAAWPPTTPRDKYIFDGLLLASLMFIDNFVTTAWRLIGINAKLDWLGRCDMCLRMVEEPDFLSLDYPVFGFIWVCLIWCVTIVLLLFFIESVIKEHSTGPHLTESLSRAYIHLRSSDDNVQKDDISPPGFVQNILSIATGKGATMVAVIYMMAQIRTVNILTNPPLVQAHPHVTNLTPRFHTLLSWCRETGQYTL